MGTVVDPATVHPTTVAITWADPCEVEVRLAAAPVQYRYVFAPLTGMSLRFHLESPFPWR